MEVPHQEQGLKAAKSIGIDGMGLSHMLQYLSFKH
jgi:hypothetical protein